MNLCASVFVYVGSIALYKRIVNANTQNIRIANADNKGLKLFACVFIRRGTRTFFREKSSEGVLNPSYYNKPYYARKTPPSSKTIVFESTSPLRAGTF